MNTPQNWQTLQRHPFSAQYSNIEGRGWELYLANVREHGLTGRKITIHEGQVIDGWQLQRACVQLGIAPEYQELPAGWTPEAFVSAANDHRRHETQEQAMKRAEERRRRVAQARAEGHSIRAIADQEGVSKTQVERDLGEPAAVPGGTLATVAGTDGKTYPATKPPQQSRAERVGQVPPKPFVPPEGEPGPEQEMKAVNAKIESFCKGLMEYVNDNLPDDHWLRDANAREGARQKFLNGCEMLRAKKCVALCPKCAATGKDANGKTCPSCHGTRRLPKLNMEAVKP